MQGFWLILIVKTIPQRRRRTKGKWQKTWVNSQGYFRPFTWEWAKPLGERAGFLGFVVGAYYLLVSSGILLFTPNRFAHFQVKW